MDRGSVTYMYTLRGLQDWYTKCVEVTEEGVSYKDATCMYAYLLENSIKKRSIVGTCTCSSVMALLTMEATCVVHHNLYGFFY